MEKRNMIIITIVAVACIAMTALYFSGAIHTGSFAAQGAKFGPGTYVVGTDIPQGRYSFDGPYDLEGRAIYKASSNGGLSLSDNNVEEQFVKFHSREISPDSFLPEKISVLP